MSDFTAIDRCSANDNRVELRQARSKRAIDLIVASLALVILAPLLLVVAALVAADGGPVLFRHPRVGRNGVPFQCLKFRTMVPKAEIVLRSLLESDPKARREWEANFKLKNDPRITRIGRFLRRSSIDELPQLINVLKGDMALVGPRPIVREEVHRYGAGIDFYYRCRPGITGAWQVSGRNDTSYVQRVRLDLEYARNISLKQDIRILMKTAKVVVLGLGAY